MNPPYVAREMRQWMAKAVNAVTAKGGADIVVCLVPSRTDTIWWHEFALLADEIRFIKGRLRFDDGRGRATFPSVVLIFRRRA